MSGSKDLGVVIQSYLDEARAIERKVTAAPVSLPREAWKQLRAEWERVCTGIVAALKQFVEGSTPTIVTTLPPRKEIETLIRTLHNNVKAAFVKAEAFQSENAPAQPTVNEAATDSSKPANLGAHRNDNMRQVFDKLDADSSGYLEPSELNQALRNMNIELNDENTYLLLRRIDSNSDGLITFAEFRQLLIILKWFRSMFIAADVDRSGSISHEELDALMEQMNFQFSQLVIELLFKIFDDDKSGTIDYQEFFTLILFLRELEDVYDKRQSPPADWAVSLLGLDASPSDLEAISRLVTFTEPFEEFAQKVALHKLEVRQRAALRQKADLQSHSSAPAIKTQGSWTAAQQQHGQQQQRGFLSTQVQNMTISAPTPGSSPLPTTNRAPSPSGSQIARSRKAISINDPNLYRLLPAPRVPSLGYIIKDDDWIRKGERFAVPFSGLRNPLAPNIDLIISPTNELTEFGDVQGNLELVNQLEDWESSNAWYRDNFYEKPHINLLGQSENDFYVISVEDSQNARAKVLLRNKRGTQRFLLNGSAKNARELLVSERSELANVNLYPVTAASHTDLSMDLLAYEEKQIVKVYKFGVLLMKDGQNELQCYNNRDSTPELDEFLDFVGTRVVLQGWTRFRGGLDVRKDLTGTESYYTVHRGFEVMFHVSTMIPFYPNDAQQVERKRHLGNDVVIVVFQDSQCTTPFDPAGVRSQFNTIFCVVRPDPVATAASGTTHYKIAFVNRLGVPAYGPPLPAEGTYPKNSALRDFLITKLINSERAAMWSPDFLGKHVATRKVMLSDIVERNPEEKSNAMKAVNAVSSAFTNTRIGNIFRRNNAK